MFIAIRHLQPFAGASVQVLRLWGTPTADQGDSTFYEIVVDQCKQWVNDNPTFEMDGFSWKIQLFVRNLTCLRSFLPFNQFSRAKFILYKQKQPRRNKYFVLIKLFTDAAKPITFCVINIEKPTKKGMMNKNDEWGDFASLFTIS
jgi:hypothetical protein